ncbi:unnamed protein product, partial [Mesorhabditis spiculigera]
MGAGNSIEGPVVESGYGGRYWERDYDTLSKKYWDALEQSQNLNIQLGSLRNELRNLKAEQSGSHLKWNQEKKAHLEKVDLIYKVLSDTPWLPEGVTDATLLLFLPSSEPGYEMKNGRPHTERLRTDKGLIGFIFFETVGKAQECMRMFSKYRPPDLPYGFSYYGNAAHINTLLHKHLSF